VSTPTPPPEADFAAVDAHVAGMEDASGIAEVIAEYARVGRVRSGTPAPPAWLTACPQKRPADLADCTLAAGHVSPHAFAAPAGGDALSGPVGDTQPDDLDVYVAEWVTADLTAEQALLSAAAAVVEEAAPAGEQCGEELHVGPTGVWTCQRQRGHVGACFARGTVVR
jgi:hypothetical protein